MAALTAPTVGAWTTAGASSSRAGAVVINVNGALDPDAVARQIRDLLDRRARRGSGVSIGRVSTVGP